MVRVRVSLQECSRLWTIHNRHHHLTLVQITDPLINSVYLRICTSTQVQLVANEAFTVKHPPVRYSAVEYDTIIKVVKIRYYLVLLHQAPSQRRPDPTLL
jgi:hypothetical protein